jgi:acyl-CoA-binding protein
MSDLKKTFEAASEAVKQLPERPDNDMLLKLYALYKQATEGDVSGPKPSLFDFKGFAKNS